MNFKRLRLFRQRKDETFDKNHLYTCESTIEIFILLVKKKKKFVLLIRAFNISTWFIHLRELNRHSSRTARVVLLLSNCSRPTTVARRRNWIQFLLKYKYNITVLAQSLSLYFLPSFAAPNHHILLFSGLFHLSLPFVSILRSSCLLYFRSPPSDVRSRFGFHYLIKFSVSDLMVL